MEDSLKNLPELCLTKEEPDPFADVPLWSLWLSTIILSITFLIGLPLNGATVIIFWKQQKLRHLVNFVLLLDCLSHIILCLICIPIYITSVWSSSYLAAAGLGGLSALQQVVGNFSNIYSTFLTVSIAILRYRRLCWKKKDQFSASNAIKWSVLSGSFAVTFSGAQCYAIFLSNDQKIALAFYLVKISLIILSMAIVFFCYIGVSTRVWKKPGRKEDSIKKRKSRSVHLRATIHSCVQIVLVILTLSPYLYEQTLEAYASISKYVQSIEGASSLQQEELQASSTTVQTNLGESLMSEDEKEDWLRSQQSPMIQEACSTSSTTLSPSDNHFGRLIGITINYVLLVLGTPTAYIASCHRFREHFTSILFSHDSPNPNSASQNLNNSRHPKRRNQFSRDCEKHGSQEQEKSPGRTFSKTSGGRHYSSSISRTTPSFLPRNSISLSVCASSTAVTMPKNRNGSTKSRNSLKRCKSTRKGSRGLLGTEFIIVDSESTTMLDQDLSKETLTPSPTMTEGGSISGNNGDVRKGSIFCTNLQTAFVTTTIDSLKRKNSLHTILQNYSYDFSDDLGELV